MRNFFHVIVAALLVFCALAATSWAQTLTLYSHRHYAEDDLLYERFREETGIEIRVVKAGADELIERLRAEGPNTLADLLITADAGRLVRAKQAGLLQPVFSEILAERVPEHLRDGEGYWYGLSKRARVIIYARERVNRAELSTYEALAGSQWRGRILARSSSNIYNQSLMASLIAALGADGAGAWAREVRQNLSRRPQGSDRDQIRAVAAGLGDVALANTYYLGLMLNSADPSDRRAGSRVNVFFSNQEDRGTHINISGAGVIGASAQVDLARRFLEYMVSDEVQGTFPSSTFEYPVVSGVEWSPLQREWGAFKEDELSLETLGRLNEEAVRLFNRAGWD